MDPKQAKLIERIHIAFAGVKLGDGISLNMTEYYDSGGSAVKFLHAAKHDERHDWRAIPDQTLEQFRVTFSFTDLDGFRFYLPAYMDWAVRNHDKSDSIISDFTIYALDTNHYLFEKQPMSKVFSGQQLDCIVEFLEYCLQHEDTCDTDVSSQNLRKLKASLAERD